MSLGWVEVLRDDFLTDRLAADWVYDAGAGTLSVASGVLTPTSTALKDIYYSAGGSRSEQRATVKFTTGSASTQFVAVMLKRTGSQTYLFVQESGVGIRLFKSVAGTTTAFAAATSHTTLANSTSYWLRGYVKGNVLTGEIWTTDPDLGGSPLSSQSFTLTGSDATSFGTGVSGYAGLRLAPSATAGWSYDDFSVSANGAAFGQTTSVQSAQTLARAKARALTLASEAAASGSLGRIKTRGLARADEGAVAQAVGPLRSRPLGQATETDTTRPLDRAKLRTLLASLETDTASGLVRHLAVVPWIEGADSSVGRHEGTDSRGAELASTTGTSGVAG